MRWMLLALFALVIAAGEAPPPAVDPLPGLLARLGGNDGIELGNDFAALGERAVDPLVREIAEAKEQRLANALGALGAIAAKHPTTLPRIMPVLLAATRSEGYWGISGVHDAVRELGPAAKDLVPELIIQLRRTGDDGLHNVLWSLERIGPPAATAAPFLMRLLDGPEAKYAVDTLAAIGPAALPILRDALPDHPLPVLKVVTIMGDAARPLAPAVRSLLALEDREVRAAAVEAMCQIADAPTVGVVVSAGATDAEAVVRRVAARNLQRIDEAAAAPLVLKLLDDADAEVITAAVWRAGSVGLDPARAISAVAKHVAASIPQQRRAAARALGQLASGSHAGAGFTDRLDEPAAEALRRQAFTALRPLLGDAEDEVCNEAAVALGAIGIADHALREQLLDRLARGGDQGWSLVNVIVQLGLTAEETPHLLARLADQSLKQREQVVFATRALRPADPHVITALIRLLGDADPRVRGYAATTLGEIGPPAAAACEALLALLGDSDRNAAGWAAQALGKLGQGVVPRLIVALRAQADPERAHRRALVDALRDHGPLAKAALPDLIALLGSDDKDMRVSVIAALSTIGVGDPSARQAVATRLGSTDEEESGAVLMALVDIGLDETVAKRLAVLRIPESKWIGGGVFIALVPWPEQARGFLKLNPELLHSMQVEQVIAGFTPAPAELRAAILAQPELPMRLMALSGDRTYLPLIEAKVHSSVGYARAKTSSLACMLGAIPERIVRIDATHSGDFKPASAWPGIDRRRMKPRGNGHGDGIAFIDVTGSVRFADGTMPTSITFTALNDRMLLGERQEHAESCRYDPLTGRFVLVTSVFAAYSSGDGEAEEAGPYQTGSLKLRLQAMGAKPLRVVVYDEMPDLAITIERSP